MNMHGPFTRERARWIARAARKAQRDTPGRVRSLRDVSRLRSPALILTAARDERHRAYAEGVQDALLYFVGDAAASSDLARIILNGDD